MSTSSRLALTSAFSLGNATSTRPPSETTTTVVDQGFPFLPIVAFFTAESIREFPFDVYHSRDTYQHRGASRRALLHRNHGARDTMYHAA